MKSRLLSGNRSSADKGDGDETAVNQQSEEVALGAIIWVSLHGSSWWPAQVVDVDTVSQDNKPRNRSVGEVLVRLYGSYKYMYVDPMTCCAEFDNILKQNNGNHSVIFKKALEQDLAGFKSGRAKGKGIKSEDKAEEARSTKRKEDEMQRKVDPHSPKSKARISSWITAGGTLQTMMKDGNSLPAKTEETKSKKQKHDPVQKKLESNGPCSLEVSPKILQKTVKNGNLLSKKVSEEAKSRTPKQAATLAGKSQELTARRMKVMRGLGLIAPSGSPFHRNGHICPNLSLCS